VWASPFCNRTAYAQLLTGAVSGPAGDYPVSSWANPAGNASWRCLFDIGSSSYRVHFTNAVGTTSSTTMTVTVAKWRVRVRVRPT
jgi:hypothetical protein